MSHKRKYSEHHMIPKFNDDWSWFTRDKINVERIEDNKHVNHHRIFGAETPQQQLIHILDFNKKIRNDDFVKEIIKVLDKYIYNYYKVECHITSELGDLLKLEQEYFKR